MNVSENVSDLLPIFKTPQCSKPLQGQSLKPVGAAGLEPATSCSQSRRATGLRHAPNKSDSRRSDNPTEPPKRLTTACALAN